ncbi:MAG: aspartate 1-decarboxylase [Desulfotomaculaceae bacterium]|nr:aspartate 1-decarboxylase [Desulfotomaculaceae bacterium]
MLITMFKSKIHRAIVTEANLNYMGSITIDETLMEAADIMTNEKVQVVNNNNGARFETYVIKGPRDSGVICLNGAAARLVQPGDNVIIISYAMLDHNEARAFKPTIIMVDENNHITGSKYGEAHSEVG